MTSYAVWKAKSRLATLVGHAGGYAIARRLTRNSPRILMYHRFSRESSNRAIGVEEFEYQVRELARLFNPKTMRELAAGLHAGAAEPGSVVITVDDGYADFHKFALPILRKWNVPATVFVTTGFLDRRLWLWPDVIEYALDHATAAAFEVVHPIEGRLQLRRASEEERESTRKRLVSASLSLQDEDMRAFHAHLLQLLDVDLPTQPTSDYAPLTWDQVRELTTAGIEIGAHTETHPCLSRLEPSKLESEVLGSKRRIEEELGHAIDTFCYPNGTPQDVNEEVKRVVKAAGFKSAPVAYFDARVADDMFELRRYPVGSWRRKFLQAVHGVELLSVRRAMRSAESKVDSGASSRAAFGRAESEQ